MGTKCAWAAVVGGVIIAGSVARADVRTDGACGFPQKDATVLCDTPDLRLSVFSDAAYLYVQAVVWNDPDNTEGETADGRAIGDNSALMIDADGNGKATPNVDRTYSLDPWPKLPGLRYSVVLGDNITSHLADDSKGHGAISYLMDKDEKRVRVDSFLVPLAEIGRKPG